MAESKAAPEANAGAGAEDLDSESVEMLRERLSAMKRLMAERQANNKHNPASTEEIWSKKRRSAYVINANFLSFAFAGALLVIISVSVYAFYNLYNAILKKFPSRHEEL